MFAIQRTQHAAARFKRIGGMNCPTGVADSAANASVLLEAKARAPRDPLIACWMGGATARSIRERLSEAGIPNYETPDEAVRAFLHLAEYQRNQTALLETPAPSVVRVEGARAKARAIIEAALADGRTLLNEIEAKQVLAAYGVPVARTVHVADAASAARTAAEWGGPVALKILSRDITHKSDVGGVALDLAGPDAVQRAAEEMMTRVRVAAPRARLDGFTVQDMVKKPRAFELIVGIAEDATFGPVLLVGQGGVAVEILRDRVMGLPPLNSALAHDMIARTRVSRLLQGFRDRPPADLNAIAGVLQALSDMCVDLPEIAELDINPLLADETGGIALDARIVARRAPSYPETRLAIRPYPEALGREITLEDGGRLRVRAIRPEDAPALAAMAQRTSQEDLRLRFHGAVRALDALSAARLSQIDYDREMALVAIGADGGFAGVGRLVFDPDFTSAEYALIVRSDLHRRGIGRALLAAILSHAKSRGAQAVWGDVVVENSEMLSLVRAMGARLESVAGAPNLTRSTFNVGTAPL